MPIFMGNDAAFPVKIVQMDPVGLYKEIQKTASKRERSELVDTFKVRDAINLKSYEAGCKEGLRVYGTDNHQAIFENVAIRTNT
jgi:hypothetical protein